jgi:hypothetical protein
MRIYLAQIGRTNIQAHMSTSDIYRETEHQVMWPSRYNSYLFDNDSDDDTQLDNVLETLQRNGYVCSTVCIRGTFKQIQFDEESYFRLQLEGINERTITLE